MRIIRMRDFKKRKGGDREDFERKGETHKLDCVISLGGTEREGKKKLPWGKGRKRAITQEKVEREWISISSHIGIIKDGWVCDF